MSTTRKALAQAEALLEAAIHSTRADHPRALRKMQTALEFTRAAFILITESEQASVGHPDDPARRPE